MWTCQCSCKNKTIKDMYAASLLSQETLSCGCLASERVSKRNKNNRKYETLNKRLYRIWIDMKTRCFNKNSIAYKYYGERGITICDEWKIDYVNFESWALLNGYSDSLTIDRIDVNGNYEPCNCRWETSYVQTNNRRDNHILVFNGMSNTMKEWSDITGISYEKIKSRINKLHWSISKTLTTK